MDYLNEHTQWCVKRHLCGSKQSWMITCWGSHEPSLRAVVTNMFSATDVEVAGNRRGFYVPFFFWNHLHLWTGNLAADCVVLGTFSVIQWQRVGAQDDFNLSRKWWISQAPACSASSPWSTVILLWSQLSSDLHFTAGTTVTVKRPQTPTHHQQTLERHVPRVEIPPGVD